MSRDFRYCKKSRSFIATRNVVHLTAFSSAFSRTCLAWED